jgi:hypothetical protein
VGEWLQKLMHTAYRRYSSRVPSRDLLRQVAQWIMRHAAVQHGQRLIELASDDLVHAARLGLDEVLSMLVSEQLVDPLRENAQTKQSPANEALLAAASEGQCKCIQILLDVKADPNVKAPDKRTPLIVAAQAEIGEALRAQTMEILVARGARRQVQWSRLTADEWAAQKSAPGKGGAAPAPRVDRSANRLRPPARGGGRRWLDLTHLRPRRGANPAAASDRALREQLPGLADQLEFSLRVYMNGGKENIPLADLPHLPKASLVVELRSGIILGSDDSIEEEPSAYGVAECYSRKRLLAASKCVRPRLSLDASPLPHQTLYLSPLTQSRQMTTTAAAAVVAMAAKRK